MSARSGLYKGLRGPDFAKSLLNGISLRRSASARPRQRGEVGIMYAIYCRRQRAGGMSTTVPPGVLANPRLAKHLLRLHLPAKSTAALWPSTDAARLLPAHAFPPSGRSDPQIESSAQKKLESIEFAVKLVRTPSCSQFKCSQHLSE